MNDQPTSSELLATAKAALQSCLEQLDQTDPDWANIHLQLGTSQRTVAIAEHLASIQSVAQEQHIEAEEVVVPSELVQEEVEVITEAEALSHTPQLDPTAIKSSPATTSPAGGPSLAETLSEQKLVALKSALSINDRVRFSTLLTDGDVPAFMQLCETIERCSQFEEAQLLLLESTADVDWEDEDQGGLAFLTLVRRLFVTA